MGTSQNAGRTVFFMARPGHLQEWFWRGPARERAAELGFSVGLNERGGQLGPDDWAAMLEGVEALLTAWDSPPLDASVLARADALRIVGHVGGSVAQIATPALFERGVKLTTANALMARTVAEWCLMMTLVGLRQPLRYAQFGGGGRLDWETRRYNLVPSEATVGIWGYGDVARAFLRLLRPLEPRRILVHDPYLDAGKAAAEGVEAVGFDELFARADVLHCLTGLTPQTKGRVGAGQLAALREGAVLLNCGRAPLVQEEALVAELRRGRILAIMDVFEREPLPEDHPYRGMDNVILTPHNAGHGRDAQYLGAMLDEFDRFFAGRPLHWEVDPERARTMTDPSLLRRG